VGYIFAKGPFYPCLVTFGSVISQEQIKISKANNLKVFGWIRLYKWKEKSLSPTI
jgi:hypothetical protein